MPIRSGVAKKYKPEKAIQKEILDWLATTDLLHWRQNAGILFVGKRMVRLGEAGLPDIIVIVPPNGRFLGLEVKSATGRLRPAQAAFYDRLKASGGMYTVVRTLDQAKEAVARALGGEVVNGKDWSYGNHSEVYEGRGKGSVRRPIGRGSGHPSGTPLRF